MTLITTTPSAKIGMTPAEIKNVVASDGILYFVGLDAAERKKAMSTTIEHILKGDFAIKGNIIIKDGAVDDQYHDIESDHSTVTYTVGDSTSMTADDFIAANTTGMRRTPDLLVLGTISNIEQLQQAIYCAQFGIPAFVDVEAKTTKEAIALMAEWRTAAGERIAISNIIETAQAFVAERLFEANGNEILSAREIFKPSAQHKKDLVEIKESQGIEAMTDKVCDIIINGENGSKSFGSHTSDMIEDGTIGIIKTVEQ